MGSKSKPSMTGLLDKQLAAITKTLASASKRRDVDMQERANRETGCEPVAYPFPSSPVESIHSAGSCSEVARLININNGLLGSTGCRIDSSEVIDLGFTSPQASLRGGEDIQSEVPKLTYEWTERNTGYNSHMRLEKECLPYLAVVQLERASCEWEVADSWTKYLFGDDLNSYNALLRKGTTVQQAILHLRQITELFLQEEKARHVGQEKDSFPCRLLVSNIAADADEEELTMLFHEFEHEIRVIKFSNERHPIKRTRAAMVEMYTREAAKQASFTTGAIFGLMIDVRLATKETG